MPALLIIFILCLFPARVFAVPFLIDTVAEYTIRKDDHGGSISGILGMDWAQIARENGIDPGARLKVGKTLKIRFRRIIPETLDNGILINIPDRTLYRFENGTVRDYFFIAAGRSTWQTPLGEFTVKAKAKEPTWIVPPGIRKEMEEQGKEVLTRVPPGPDNPLGKYWLQLSLDGIGLHGTNAPHSIYKFASHGCMRLHPDIAERLFHELPVGTKGKIIYKPIKTAMTPDGRVHIEVYRDFYKRGIDYAAEIRNQLSALNAILSVDWNKVQEAAAKKNGVVTDITK